MRYLIICISFVLMSCASQSQLPTNEPPKEVQDTTKKAKLKIKPAEFFVDASEGRFIEREVKLLNTGADNLIIEKVVPSCSCSKGTVMENNIPPMSIGKIRLSVNLDGLYDDNNVVEFEIHTNAQNPVHIVKIHIYSNENKQTK